VGCIEIPDTEHLTIKYFVSKKLHKTKIAKKLLHILEIRKSVLILLLYRYFDRFPLFSSTL